MLNKTIIHLLDALLSNVLYICLNFTHFVCLHISADGVALGAAASTSQTSVQLIVFVAIMLHKVGQ